MACCVACGPEASDGGDVRVVLGTGAEAYSPIEGEPVLPMIKGFQGGFHVWTSFLAYGFQSDVLSMQLVTSWEGVEESIIDMPGIVRLTPVIDPQGVPAFATVGWPALIYNAPCAHGRRLRIDITVRDDSGRRASDTMTCIAEVAEEDRASDCGAL